jgi:hypothetical protein
MCLFSVAFFLLHIHMNIHNFIYLLFFNIIQAVSMPESVKNSSTQKQKKIVTRNNDLGHSHFYDILKLASMCEWWKI